MKKVIKQSLLVLATFIVALTLAACGTQKKAATSKAGTYSVALVVNKKQISKKHFAVVKKQTILAAMKKHFKVVDDKGFITSINGHKQNVKKNVYWLFYINGKAAQKGAGDITVKKNQKITFKLEAAKY